MHQFWRHVLRTYIRYNIDNYVFVRMLFNAVLKNVMLFSIRNPPKLNLHSFDMIQA